LGRRDARHDQWHFDIASQCTKQEQTGETILTFRRSVRFAFVIEFSQYWRRFAHSQVTVDGDKLLMIDSNHVSSTDKNHVLSTLALIQALL
jgi:hypothetical protein